MDVIATRSLHRFGHMHVVVAPLAHAFHVGLTCDTDHCGPAKAYSYGFSWAAPRGVSDASPSLTYPAAAPQGETRPGIAQQISQFPENPCAPQSAIVRHVTAVPGFPGRPRIRSPTSEELTGLHPRSIYADACAQLRPTAPPLCPLSVTITIAPAALMSASFKAQPSDVATVRLSNGSSLPAISYGLGKS